MLQQEELSFSQEPRNTAPVSSIPTSVEVESVDAVNDRVVANQSSSSAFPFVAPQFTPGLSSVFQALELRRTWHAQRGRFIEVVSLGRPE